VGVGEETQHEPGNEARLSHAGGPEHADLLLDHRCGTSRSVTRRLARLSASDVPRLAGSLLPAPRAVTSSRVGASAAILARTMSARLTLSELFVSGVPSPSACPVISTRYRRSD